MRLEAAPVSERWRTCHRDGVIVATRAERRRARYLGGAALSPVPEGRTAVLPVLDFPFEHRVEWARTLNTQVPAAPCRSERRARGRRREEEQGGRSTSSASR